MLLGQLLVEGEGGGVHRCIPCICRLILHHLLVLSHLRGGLKSLVLGLEAGVLRDVCFIKITVITNTTDIGLGI